jgi:hypothetical protein
MTITNKAQVNFAGGEIAPKVSGRIDLPVYTKSVLRMQNFIPDPQGCARFRNGSVIVHHTRLNQYAVLIPFVFDDSQAYFIEVTQGYFRFYKAGGLILEATINITGITNANPGVFTVDSHGYVIGNEILVQGVTGMTGINDVYGLVQVVDTNTFTLTDVFGTPINTLQFGTYVSGGTVSRIYEIPTPYLPQDFPAIQYSQSQDVMYATNGNYEARKLTRLSDTDWTLGRFARTADPFMTAGAITGITKANPAVVTCDSHPFVTGSQVYIDSVVGMTQVNDQWYTVTKIDGDTYSLDGVNSSGYTSYSSGGYNELYGALDPNNLANSGQYPVACCFTDDSRIVYGGTFSQPATIWGSEAPSTNGALNYDNFTTGSLATNAYQFTLSTLHGKNEQIRWISNTDLFLVVGSFGTVRRMYGSADDQPVTPLAINAKSVNNYGAQNALPVPIGEVLLYIQRGGQFVQSVTYDYLVNGYTTTSMNVVADHLTTQGLNQIVLQLGRPDLVWALRADGVLLSLTFDSKENIAAWARHQLAEGEVQSIGVLPRVNNVDQTWMVVQRYINGNVVNFVEYFADPPIFPDPDDFFTIDVRTIDDENRYLNALFEAQKQAVHLDASVVYDGSDYGTNAETSLTIGEGGFTAGNTGVTFTASEAVFDSSMIGRQIWGQYDQQGLGGGRGVITAYTSATQVTCTILSSFPSNNVFQPGNWYVTATQLSGLDYLEGETVSVVGDGMVLSSETVSQGGITIDQPASIIIVGLPYVGMIKGLPIDQGGQSGSAEDKIKNMLRLGVRFVDSAGLYFGTSLSTLTQMNFLNSGQAADRPTPLFTGTLDPQSYDDSWAADKNLYLVQNDPLPCTILSVNPYVDTTDEQ